MPVSRGREQVPTSFPSPATLYEAAVDLDVCDEYCAFSSFAPPVKSTVVLKVDFPELSADGVGGIKTVESEPLSKQTFTNVSDSTAKDTFNLKTTLLDTHTFVFEVRWYTIVSYEALISCQVIVQYRRNSAIEWVVFGK